MLRGLPRQVSLVLSPAGKILYVLSYGIKSAEELLKETGLSRNTLYYHLKDLINLGYVIKVGKGKYAITGKGKETLSKIIKEFSYSISSR